MMRILLPAGLVLVLLLAACGGDNGPSPAPTDSASTAGDERYDSLLEAVLRITFTSDASFKVSESSPSAIEALAETGDPRFVPVLVDVLRFPWFLSDETRDAALTTLSELTGEPDGDQWDWIDWVEWLAQHPEIEGPPGYQRWKGRLLGKLIDPRIGNFLTGDGLRAEIRVEEIVWGGVARDGIPDLQDPPVVPASEADYLDLDERVFGIAIHGESRAYPLRIMNAHEMANDEVGGVRLALAYCTLCGSGIAYATEIDGETLSFGTSGLLHRSNKLMYDRATASLWDQFRGTPVVGPRVGTGVRLEVLPLALTTWREWRDLHPETAVLDIDTGVYRPSVYRHEADPESIYFEYRAGGSPIFPVAVRSDRLPETEPVIGVEAGGQARAYALSRLVDEPVVNDEVGDVDVVVIATEGAAGALIYEREGITFSDAAVSGGVLTVADGDGRRWRAEDEALVLEGDEDRRLKRLESRIAYWFAWFQFNPATELYD